MNATSTAEAAGTVPRFSLVSFMLRSSSVMRASSSMGSFGSFWYSDEKIASPKSHRRFSACCTADSSPSL